MILGYTWLKDHNPEVNWQTGEVQMNRCPPQCKECCVIWKERASQRKTKARAVNVCRSGPPLEYAEDLCATFMISQKLAEGARRASETWKGLLTLPNCVKGFESVFTKKDFDIFLEHRQ